LVLGNAGVHYAAAQSNQPQQATRVARTFAFNIPSKPLLAALADFTATTGIQVIRPSAEAVTGRSTAVSGSLDANEALGRLLTGTGFSYRYTGARTAKLERLGDERGSFGVAGGTILLDTVDVQGGGTNGFVATQSATATKTNTPLIETPQTIDVVTQKQIEVQAAQTVPQALRYTSGVVAETRGTQSAWDNLFIRGFGSGATGNQYLDGLRLPIGNFATYQADPYLLDRIEILKGPASVLYGQNNPGGVANFISKMPTAEPYHEINLTGGNYNRLQSSFDLSGPVDKEGQLLYRLTGIGRTNNTQVDFVEEQRIAIAPALTWRPNVDTTLTLLASYQRDPTGGYSGFLPAKGTIFSSESGWLPTSFFEGDPNFNTFKKTQYGVGYIFEHKFDDDLTFRQNARYNSVDVDYQAVLGLGWDSNFPHSLKRFTMFSSENLSGFNIDNQVIKKFDTGPLRHTVLLGLDAQQSWWSEQNGSGKAPPLDVLNPVYYQQIETPPASGISKQRLGQLGIYAQDQIRLGNWALVLGGRQDWAESDTDDLLNGTKTKQKDQAFTGRAGVVYLFDNGVAPYVSYSTSFQPAVGTDFFHVPFTPTTGEQYEAGVKFQPKDSNSFVTLSAFDLTQQNVLTTDPDPAHSGFNIQTGEIRSRGIELSGVASVSNELNVMGSYTYLDAKVTKSNSDDLGKTPIYIPNYTASFWADYTFQSGRAAGFGLGGGIRYVGLSYGDSTNRFKVPAFTVFDARMQYDFSKRFESLKGWQASVNLMNLFDNKYVSGCSSYAFCIYGQRRTILGTLKYQW
jgi:iron complex outermembrane receptor protein